MYWWVKVSVVTSSKGIFFATPALLIMMSIWKLPDLQRIGVSIPSSR